jgi:hypothetical protein
MAYDRAALPYTHQVEWSSSWDSVTGRSCKVNTACIPSHSTLSYIYMPYVCIVNVDPLLPRIQAKYSAKVRASSYLICMALIQSTSNHFSSRANLVTRHIGPLLLQAAIEGRVTRGRYDWQWLYSCVPHRLRQLHDDGVRIVVMAQLEERHGHQTESLSRTARRIIGDMKHNMWICNKYLVSHSKCCFYLSHAMTANQSIGIITLCGA